MLLLLLLAALPGYAMAQVAITGSGPTGTSGPPLGVYVDFDANGNVTTIYSSPQDTTAHPNTTWLPINDARVTAYVQAHPAPAGLTPAPLQGVPSR